MFVAVCPLRGRDYRVIAVGYNYGTPTGLYQAEIKEVRIEARSLKKPKLNRFSTNH